MNFTFTIKCPPSLNVQKKFGIGQKKRFRDNLVLEMLGAIPPEMRPKAHEKLLLATSKTKRMVSFLRFWYVGKVGEVKVDVKELDKNDNLPGACKPVLDELKLVTWRGNYLGHKFEREGFGFIFDDNEKYCVALYDQKRDPQRAGELEVTVKDI